MSMCWGEGVVRDEWLRWRAALAASAVSLAVAATFLVGFRAAFAVVELPDVGRALKAGVEVYADEFSLRERAKSSSAIE